MVASREQLIQILAQATSDLPTPHEHTEPVRERARACRANHAGVHGVEVDAVAIVGATGTKSREWSTYRLGSKEC
jgi:hypothetical protein